MTKRAKKQMELPGVPEVPPPLRQVHPALLFMPKAKYLSATTADEAKVLVDGFVKRALADSGISYKERFLGTSALFAYLLTMVMPDRQRGIRGKTVEAYGREYDNGMWRVGAETDYTLSEYGGKIILTNGQHRATAFSQPTRKVQMEVWLCYAKDPLAHVGMDQNEVRSAQDIRRFSNGDRASAAAISAAIMERHDFPLDHYTTAPEKVAEIESYDQADKLAMLPKGTVGELGALLRCMRLDPPGVPLARAWITAFLRGRHDIFESGRVEQTLAKAHARWARTPNLTNGRTRSRAIAHILMFYYRAFYEGRVGGSLPEDINYVTAPLPIDAAYVAAEKVGNPKLKVSRETLDLIRFKSQQCRGVDLGGVGMCRDGSGLRL